MSLRLLLNVSIVTEKWRIYSCKTINGGIFRIIINVKTFLVILLVKCFAQVSGCDLSRNSSGLRMPIFLAMEASGRSDHGTGAQAGDYTLQSVGVDPRVGR